MHIYVFLFNICISTLIVKSKYTIFYICDREFRHTGAITICGREFRHTGDITICNREFRHTRAITICGREFRHTGAITICGREFRHTGAITICGHWTAKFVIKDQILNLFTKQSRSGL